jgi:hypothetical protein
MRSYKWVIIPSPHQLEPVKSITVSPSSSTVSLPSPIFPLPYPHHDLHSNRNHSPFSAPSHLIHRPVAELENRPRNPVPQVNPRSRSAAWAARFSSEKKYRVKSLSRSENCLARKSQRGHGMKAWANMGWEVTVPTKRDQGQILRSKCVRMPCAFLPVASVGARRRGMGARAITVVSGTVYLQSRVRVDRRAWSYRQSLISRCSRSGMALES